MKLIQVFSENRIHKNILYFLLSLLAILILHLNPGFAVTTILDEFDGSAVGDEHGIIYDGALYGQGAVFSQSSESRVQYPFSMGLPKQGTLEFIVKIDRGYNFWDYTLSFDSTKALLFTTDVQFGDVTWPGSMWLYVYANGRIQLTIATVKYGTRPAHELIANETNFRFDEWHEIGISFGSEGQWIMVDGEVVASNSANTQPLGMGGTHSAPVDIPTLGESVPGFWQNNRYEGGFEGIVECFRASDEQQDWQLQHSFSHVALAVDTLNSNPGDTLLIPVNFTLVNLSNFMGSSIEMSIDGFQRRLNFLEVITDSSLTAGWSVQVNDTDSLLILALAGEENIVSNGVLFWLKMAVPDSADGFIPIIIKSALFNESNWRLTLNPGGVNIQQTVLYGDVSLNGDVRAYDGSLILQYLVNKINLNRQQLLNANVSLDTTISALDASLILRYRVGLIDSLPFQDTRNLLFASGDINMEGAQLNAGETVIVPLQLTNSENILSFESVITYDPTHLTFNKVSWAGLMDDSAVEVNVENGKIKVAAAGSIPNIPVGILGNLTFTVNENFNTNATTVTLQKLRWNEEPVMTNVAGVTLSNPAFVNENRPGIPLEFELEQNYPNPFNPATKISFQLPKATWINLSIYSITGQLVCTLVNEFKKVGFYSVKWNAANVGAGVYFYRISTNEQSAVKKCILMK